MNDYLRMILILAGVSAFFALLWLLFNHNGDPCSIIAKAMDSALKSDCLSMGR